MTFAPLTLGTAGHIDHGKTALVRALTGVDTDRLPQERARGISIELGFAPLVLPSGRRLSVVDVPGHERFVRTMIAGASGIDLALLVVACDDGVMPQTREHLAICELLEVGSLVVAMTKRDAVDETAAELSALEVTELLAPTAYADAELIETSVRTHLGLDALRAALERAATAVVTRAAPGPPRLWVDRSFTLHGIGTVVTGTLRAGSLRTGDRLAVLPRGNEVRIRSLEVHDRPVAEAAASQRVAVALAGSERAGAPRGSLLTAPGAMRGSYRLDVRLHALAGGAGVRDGDRLQVMLGTAEVAARVVLLEAGELLPGGTALAQLRLTRPLAAAAGERLVLRGTSPPATVAGAVVLDPSPRRHASDAEARMRLGRIEAGEAPDPPPPAPVRREPPPAPPPPPAGDDGPVRLPGGVVVPRAERDRARAVVLALGEGGAGFTLAQVRDALGSSRRVVQALLEHFDGEGVTRRVGDERVLRTRGRGAVERD